MQIQKIKKIENFEGIKSIPAEVEFKNFNIVFGDNGSGKSRVVRAIKTFFEKGTIEKHYFYPSEPSELKFTIDGNDYSYDDAGAYTPAPPAGFENLISIYDSDFIDNNLKINPDEQGHKLISIAAFNKCSDLIDKIDSIKNNMNTIKYDGFSAKAASAIEELKKDLPSHTISANIKSLDYNFFFKKENWDTVAILDILKQTQNTIDGIATIKDEELEKIKEEKNALILQIINFDKDKKNLEEFLSFMYPYSSFSIDFERIKSSFTKYIDAIAKLTSLQKYSDDQITFIKMGLKLMAASPNCPFCFQEIKSLESRTKMNEYQELVQSLKVNTKEEFITELNACIESIDKIPSVDNLNAEKYISLFKQIASIITDVKFSIWEIQEISRENISKLKNKLALSRMHVETDQVKSITLPEDTLSSLIEKEIEVINKTIENNTAKFSINKQMVQKIYDKNYKGGIETLRDKIKQLEKIIKEQEELIKIKSKKYLIKNLISNLREVQRIEPIIENLKELSRNFSDSLANEMDTFGKEYGESLQKYYSHFYPNGVFNFIDWSSSTDRRGRFKLNVSLSAKNKDRDIGGKEPKSVLSEGNYNALALAYFFALNDKANPDIIIFDDPITGMDTAKRFQLITLMCELNKTKQVFVFTHDILFKNYLCDALPEHIKIEQEKKDINKNLTNTRYYSACLIDNNLTLLPNEYFYEEILTQLQKIKDNGALTPFEISLGYGTLRLALEYFLQRKLIKNIPHENSFSERLRRYREIVLSPIDEADRIVLKNMHIACSKSGPHLDSTGGDSETYLKKIIVEFLTIDGKYN